MRTFSPVAESLVIALACAAQTQAQVLRPIGADDLCVSNGEITRQGGELKIDTASSRAELRYPTAQTVEIRFTYRGPSYADKPLASGEIRRQIGLKLRAFNQCNLVYAMWHIEPDTRVAVSVKRNPGMSTHEQCLANGYVNLGPTLSGTPPPITPGSPHVFRAELHGAELLVTADGHPAWRGDIGSAAAGLEGPVGLRTDNARFSFSYFAEPKPLGTIDEPCIHSAGD